MCAAAQIKKAVVGAQAALDAQVGGDGGIKTTGNQREHGVLGAEWETTQALGFVGNDKQAIVLDFEGHQHLRLMQAHSPRLGVLQKAAPHVTLYLSGGEIVFAMTFYPDTEALACERLAPVSQGFLENILQITQRVSVYQGEVADAGGAGKHLRYLIDGLLTGIRC